MSRYKTGDSRRDFEQIGQSLNWDDVYEMVSQIALLTKTYEYFDQNPDKKTYTLIRNRGLGSLVRYSMDYCGEKNGYEISAAALEELNKTGKILWGREGPHYHEHLIPVNQCTKEFIKNRSLENVKSFYLKQRIIITLRTEQKKIRGQGQPLR